MNNPFKVGDLVKLRPDVLGRHSRSIPAHAGFTTAEFQWRETLRNLAGKTGKIERVFPDSGNVNVEYPQSWTSKDEHGHSYTVNTIGINYKDLVPSTEPVQEGILGTINPAGLGVAARQLVAAFNHGQIDKNVLTKKMEELMWQSRTRDPNAWGWLKGTVDRLKQPSNPGIRLKFEEGVGYVYDKDMKKDPKHIKGKRWTVKYESEQDLDEHGHTMKTPVNEGEIRDIVQELLKEMWIGFEEEMKETVDPKGLSYSIKMTYDGIIKAKLLFKNTKNPQIKVKYQEAGRNLIKKMNDALVQYKQLTGKDWAPAYRPNPEWFESESPAVARAPKYDPVLELKKKVVETRETRDKNYIIWARSGPGGASYYCESPTQGGRMVQFSRDMAKRFQTLEQVYRKIAELKAKYKGMTNWNYEIVQNPFTSAVPFTQPISPNRKGHTISRPVKVEGEWIVKWMTDGKRDEGKTYYTDDRDDAFSTYASMVKSAEELNQQS